MKTISLFRSILLAVCVAIPAAARGSAWYARAHGTGDGKTRANPIGSSAALDAGTKPGDVILLLPGEAPFDGGIALKPGQTLMGLAEGGRKPSIKNTSTNQNNGNGVVLADNCKILNVQIERTDSSGILGLDVTGAFLHAVDVKDANQSTNFTSVVANVLGRIPHGGILFLTTRSGQMAENRLHECTVTNAGGISIGAVALAGGRHRLVVSRTRTEKGTAIPPLLDTGFLALADGRSSETQLELADVISNGRLTDQGRNVIVFASAGAKVTARIERSTMGACGQDGVVAVAAMVPATVEVQIRDSVLEKAGQMNIEGTILNLPPSDPARANDSLVSFDVERCVIREAGAVGRLRNHAENIWLGPTVFGPGPFAQGRYRLSVRNSTLEKATHNGIRFGAAGSEFKIAPDESDYEVLLQNNTIRENGSSEITLAASKARVNARQNWWGVSTGLAANRIILLEKAQRSQLDASAPLTRPVETAPSY